MLSNFHKNQRPLQINLSTLHNYHNLEEKSRIKAVIDYFCKFGGNVKPLSDKILFNKASFVSFAFK